jgi:hypothetical protein
MFCSNCGKPLPDDSRFCPVCGAPQPGPTMSGGPAPGAYGGGPVVPPDAPPPAQRRPLKIILGIALPLVVVLAIAALMFGGILPNPFAGEPTTTAGETTLKPTAKPTKKPSTPATSTTSPTATTETSWTSETTTPPVELSYSEILDYFEEIALRREYGGGSFDGVVCRWQEPIKVDISGSYTQDDYDWLLAHIDYLNSLGCLPVISVVPTSDANYHVFFTELNQLPNVIPGYVEGNWGFVSINWDSNGQVYLANMGIASDVTNQRQRNHLILEEFTQGLGLLNDSYKYPDSIFQADWTETQSITALDEWVIRLLYSPDIQAGMKDGVRDILADWLITQ